MKHEFEAKFLNINVNQLESILLKNGFIKTQEQTVFRRVVYSLPNDTSKWLRLREEGNRTTLAIKMLNSNTIQGLFESELIINSFNSGLDFLESLGLKQRSYQENLRIVWQKDESFVAIDTWPSLNPFCEIEAPTPELVKSLSLNLGFTWDSAFFGTPDLIYQKEFGISPDLINNLPKLDFGVNIRDFIE